MLLSAPGKRALPAPAQQNYKYSDKRVPMPQNGM